MKSIEERFVTEAALDETLPPFWGPECVEKILVKTIKVNFHYYFNMFRDFQ